MEIAALVLFVCFVTMILIEWVIVSSNATPYLEFIGTWCSVQSVIQLVVVVSFPCLIVRDTIAEVSRSRAILSARWNLGASYAGFLSHYKAGT